MLVKLMIMGNGHGNGRDDDGHNGGGDDEKW